MHLEERLRKEREHNEVILLNKATQLAQKLTISFYDTFNSYLASKPLTKENCYHFLEVCSLLVSNLYREGKVTKVKYTLDYETLYNTLVQQPTLTISPLIRTGILDIVVGLFSRKELQLVIVDLEIDKYKLPTEKDKQNMYLISNSKKLED